jgi:hypothetical protein
MFFNNKRQGSGIEIPDCEPASHLDESPYFDYHHMKTIENVSQLK